MCKTKSPDSVHILHRDTIQNISMESTLQYNTPLLPSDKYVVPSPLTQAFTLSYTPVPENKTVKTPENVRKEKRKPHRYSLHKP